MENQYEEVLKLLQELEEGMTPETLKNLTTEEMCYVIEQMAQIKGKIAVLKDDEEKENEEE